MRSKILDLLKKHTDTFISGEQIAEQLQVSRTAIWKHIKTLRQQGYEIESTSRNGYRLLSSPDLLSPEEIMPKVSNLKLAQDMVYFETTDSTNNQGKILANNGAPEGTVILAEEQTGGRGRLSRAFYSPKGKGIWFSIILRPPFLPQDAPKITLMSAVAVTKAIKRAAGIDVGIKWPNDILYKGKKIVGILTEMNAEMDGINYVVLGIGINVNLTEEEIPDELKDIALSLRMIAGHGISRQELLIAILEELDILYKEAVTSGFKAIFREWKEHSVTLHQKVKVIGPSETYLGEAVDIDDEGVLLVKVDGEIRKVLAGDVSIRPQD